MQATLQQPHRAPDGAPVNYERHRPEQTTLYRLVQQHAATFFAEAEAAAAAGYKDRIKHGGRSRRHAGGKRVFEFPILRTSGWLLERGFVESSPVRLPQQKRDPYNWQRRSPVCEKALA